VDLGDARVERRRPHRVRRAELRYVARRALGADRLRAYRPRRQTLALARRIDLGRAGTRVLRAARRDRIARVDRDLDLAPGVEAAEPAAVVLADRALDHLGA